MNMIRIKHLLLIFKKNKL